MEELLEGLSWNKSKDIQNNSISLLSKLKNYDLKQLIMPIDKPHFDKSHWENAAMVLFLKGYEEVKSLSDDLFMWLQDLNWPGTQIIIDLLMAIPKEEFMVYYAKAINRAVVNNDQEWLDYLSVFLFSEKVDEHDFSDIELFNVMNKHMSFWI